MGRRERRRRSRGRSRINAHFKRTIDPTDRSPERPKRRGLSSVALTPERRAASLPPRPRQGSRGALFVRQSRVPTRRRRRRPKGPLLHRSLIQADERAGRTTLPGLLNFFPAMSESAAAPFKALCCPSFSTHAGRKTVALSPPSSMNLPSFPARIHSGRKVPSSSQLMSERKLALNI